ncbi:hypothetical protein L218DRAFT_127645 [Marasmius fiardii PR-910]|nr:hypothetical protein L218DRAFT_127645 [Marasmius fiardii PR-910]
MPQLPYSQQHDHILYRNDRLVDIAEEAAGSGSDTIARGDVFSFLCHLPLEFPILTFQQIARKTRRELDEMRKVPYEFVKNNM